MKIDRTLQPGTSFINILEAILQGKKIEPRGLYCVVEGVRFEYIAHGFRRWSSSPPVLDGIQMKIHDHNFKNILRRVMVKNHEIDEAKILAKFNELKTKKAEADETSEYVRKALAKRKADEDEICIRLLIPRNTVTKEGDNYMFQFCAILTDYELTAVVGAIRAVCPKVFE